MKNKLAITLVTLLALSAVAVVTSRIATDDGGAVVNHSQGEIVFPFSKIKASTAVRTIPYYTTAAAWPTTFVPATNFYDAGCQKITLTETPAVGAPSGLGAGLPTYCMLDFPIGSLDAGIARFYEDVDGGYGLSLCPAMTVLPVTAIPAFCLRQAGISP